MKEQLKERISKILVEEYPNGYFEEFSEKITEEQSDLLLSIINHIEEKYGFYLRIYEDPETEEPLLDFVIKTRGDWGRIALPFYFFLREIDREGKLWFVGFDVEI